MLITRATTCPFDVLQCATYALPIVLIWLHKQTVNKACLMFPDTQPSVCHNSDRLQFVNAACQSLRREDRGKLKVVKIYKHIISDDENRVLFCDVPKAGSTVFKNLWLNFTRGVSIGKYIHTRRILAKHKLRYLNTYTKSEIQTRLKTYFKFMIARHPFVRILSAYRNKLEKPNALFERIVGKYVKMRYSPANKPKDYRITFEEFVHYLVDKKVTAYNSHWKPVTYLCDPCEIHYDYIVKLETSYVDYPHILSTLKNLSDSKRGALESMRMYKVKTSNDRVKTYYSRIPVYHMNSLEEIYHIDFDLFGYTWNKTTLTPGCQINAEDKNCC